MSKRRDYRTKQGDAILEILEQSRDKHMTIHDISVQLEQRGARVGVTTVYRHIDRLLNNGLVQKYVVDGDSAAYQYIGGSCQNHFHLKCESCGELIHLECRELHGIYLHIQEDHDFLINSTKTVFYGLCGMCRAGEEQSDATS